MKPKNRNSQFKTLAVGGVLGVIAVVCMGAVNWLTYPFGTPAPADTFLFATTTTSQVGSITNGQINATNLALYIGTHFPTNTAAISTNTAALGRVSNPIVSGGQYTCPNAQGWLKVNFVLTNAAFGWITNFTTSDAQLVGSITALGTNYDSFYMRVGPNEVVGVTNKTGTLGIMNSEWRP